MKSLKPSMREKKRYLLVRGKNLKKNVEKSILEFIGILGLSEVGLSFISSSENSAVICINRNMVDKVKASFVFCSEDISVEKVSGTLRGLRGNKK